LKTLLVIAEHRECGIRAQTFSTLARAQALAENCGLKLSSVILGYGVKELARQLSSYVDKVFYIDDDRLKLYNNEVYGAQIIDLVTKWKPQHVLMGHSAISMDLMPALSAKLDVPLITDCTDLELEKDKVVASRQVYEGRVTEKISCKVGQCCLMTVRSNLKPVAKSKHGDVVELSLKLGAQPKCKVLELLKPQTDDIDIAKANIVIGVGLGIGSRENLRLVNDLADALGGVVGCTRPIVDRKWLPQTRQIGFSGRTIRPSLYIAVGLSGSIHHVKGVEGAQTIIAVNKDPGAPIFKYAKYAVVGDLFQIIPPLVERFRAS
jgi:electron transfer flavoprotein alpha subunit